MTSDCICNLHTDQLARWGLGVGALHSARQVVVNLQKLSQKLFVVLNSEGIAGAFRIGVNRISAIGKETKAAFTKATIRASRSEERVNSIEQED